MILTIYNFYYKFIIVFFYDAFDDVFEITLFSVLNYGTAGFNIKSKSKRY